MIRQYRAEDTDHLLSIWQKANELAHPFLPDTYVAQVAKDVRNIYLPNAETWVIDDGSTPMGFISLIGTEIGGLFLEPALHGRGFGKAMADHAVKIHGPLSVEVFQKNVVGLKFYVRYGFSEIDRNKHEPTGEVILKMEMAAV